MSGDEGGSTKKSGYRLEYASSARAKCKGPKPCAGTPITKGELRIGSIVDFKGNTSFAWRHWGCTTKTIFTNMKKSFESAEELDGYEDLKPEDQEKVNKAWEEGHVADEDVPDSAKKPDDDEEEKPKKKRAPVKKKAKKDEDGDEEKPKKKRAPVKKKDAAPKKKPTKKKKAISEDEESGEDFAAAMDAVSDEDEAEDTPDEDADSKKRKRPASKAKPASKSKSKKAKKTKAVSEDDDDDE